MSLSEPKPLHIHTLTADLLTPVSAFLRLRKVGKAPFLMESAAGGEQFGRFSILGTDPVSEILAQEPNQAARTQDNKSEKDSLLNLLKKFSEQKSASIAELPFSGGLVGMIGFDFVRELESFPETKSDSNPMAWLGEYNNFIVFDHLKQALHLVSRSNDKQELDRLREILQSPLSEAKNNYFKAGNKSSNFSKNDFCSAVEKLKGNIKAGDIFQAVLSQRFSREYEGDPFLLYRALRRINPSPYMFYHETPVGTLVGASPELLVGVENRTVRLLPIAGTRPRGENEAKDLELEKSLLADPKEKAEHMMLVDLARNDLGRVADYGSVKIDEQCSIHRFSHVMHMVSRVSGKLREGKNSVDALAAAFPAGTVSGAPKVRALELIFEMEPTRRGAYAGGAGFLGYDGNAELCITLRTAIAKDGVLTNQAGAGIVADSIAENEFAETEHKAGSIERAIALAAEWK